MKIKKTLEKIALYGALIASLSFSKCEKEPEGYGAVEGQVLIPKFAGDNEIYYDALQGTNVKVLGTDLITKTDSKGKYFIDSIPAGKRKVEGNSKLELKSTKSGYDPNYESKSEEVMVMNETINPVEVLKLNPSVGYPRQILHGKLYEKDGKTPIVGKEIIVYMSWTSFEPAMISSAVEVGNSITADSGRYAVYIGEKEHYFLLDKEESEKMNYDVFLYFLNSDGSKQKTLNAWKDNEGIIQKDISK